MRLETESYSRRDGERATASREFFFLFLIECPNSALGFLKRAWDGRLREGATGGEAAAAERQQERPRATKNGRGSGFYLTS